MHSGPTWARALFMQVPHTIHAGPMYYSGGTHVGPTYYLGGTHVGPTYYSGGTHVGPTYYSGGTHLGPTYPCTVHAAPLGTHILFRWDPHIVQAGPRTIQVGPTYYSVGTRAYYFVGPTVGPFSLKKIYFFHYLKIQNIFNYSLYTNIIARLCILRSHAVALLLFELCFHFISSKNIIELFIHR